VRALTAAALATVAAGLAACGEDGSTQSEVIVSAASSLEPAFTEYTQRKGIDAKQSFAGSDELAAQIRQGVRPDVYAAANTSLPDELYAEGLVTEPVVFATNELVLAVPADSPIDSLEDLVLPGTALAIGDDGVPVGDYTREVLARLTRFDRDAILANVRSQEPDVAGIVGKLTQGAVDAGFVYVTDVVAAGDALRAVELPRRLAPEVAYGAAAVEGAANPEGARSFVDGLLRGEGAEALRDAGFGPPPED
jgi:molybdate transport system substrate-binding protein